MRPWRKLHTGITESDKVALVSDGAAFLFTLLVAKQDDAGRYPWTPAKIRSLTVTRTWTPDQTDAFAQELGEADLITIHKGYVEIVGGAEKNGVPTQGKDAGRGRYYGVNSRGIHSEVLEEEKIKSREEEKAPLVVPPQTDGADAPDDDAADAANDPQGQIFQEAQDLMGRFPEWVAGKLTACISEHGAERVLYAIRQAAKYNKRSLGYIEGVLEDRGQKPKRGPPGKSNISPEPDKSDPNWIYRDPRFSPEDIELIEASRRQADAESRNVDEEAHGGTGPDT